MEEQLETEKNKPKDKWEAHWDKIRYLERRLQKAKKVAALYNKNIEKKITRLEEKIKELD